MPILPTLSPHQAIFLLLDQREAFYGGAAGGGKSTALLAAALQYVDTPGYAALILRRSFPQLSQPKMLIPLSQQWLGATDAIYSATMRQWTFPSGAVLRFGHVQDEDSIYDYQGGGYQFVGFDELTQFTPAMYEYISFSRVRRELALEEAGVPTRIRSSANPGGIGHQWVKARFVDAETRQPGAVFIPAKVSDNPGLDVADYTESLGHLGEILRQQLLDGNWGAFEGAAYPMFSRHNHVIKPFDIPDGWERFEGMDYGSTNPTAWLANAIDYDGFHIVFDELYVEQPVPHLPSDIEPQLKARREIWWPASMRPHVHADPSVFNSAQTTKWGRPPSVAEEFEAAGIPLTAANNDRRAGYLRIAELLKPDQARRFPAWHPRAGEAGAPLMFVTTACPHLIEQLQGAPLEGLGEPHPGEAVSRKWEGPWGHAHAALRYGAMSWTSPTAEQEVVDPLAPPDPPEVLRAAHLAKLEEQRNSAGRRRRFTHV